MGKFLNMEHPVMYAQTGSVDFLVDDSGADLDPASIVFLDLDGDGVAETPYGENGGRMVMNFEPTCIPVVSSISVLGGVNTTKL